MELYTDPYSTNHTSMLFYFPFCIYIAAPPGGFGHAYDIPIKCICG